MSHVLTPLTGTDDLFSPDYQQNIYRILPTALRCMNIPTPRDDLFALPEALRHLRQNEALDAEKVIVCIVDSLGLRNMDGTKLETLFKDLSGITLHSTFPSITSAAIPSINFGVPPTTHGILGHIIYFPEYGSLVDTLRMSGYKVRYRDAIAYAGIDVRILLWAKGLPELLRKMHPKLIVAEGLPQEIPGTGLGRFYVQQENLFTFRGLIDAFGMVRRVFNQYSRQHLFMTLYFPLLDTLSHKYGPSSLEYKTGCNIFYDHLRIFIENLAASEAKKTTIVLCSDHGQNSLRDDRTISISTKSLAEIQNTLKVPLGHSGRITHFYCQSTSKRRKLKRWLQEQVEDRAIILDAKDLDQAKLLPVLCSRRIQQRLGDLLLIARDGASLMLEDANSNEAPLGLLPPQWLLANHGSLTMDELLTPFVAAKATNF